MIDLEVRGFHRPSDDEAPMVVVGRRNGEGKTVLLLELCQADLHALVHELRGQATVRSQTVELAGQVASALGARIAGADLVRAQTGELTARLELLTPSHCVHVPIAPGPALAAATRLGVPLRGDESLFQSPPLPTEVSGSVAAFLATLDLRVLGQ